MKILRLTFELVTPMHAETRKYYCACGEHPATDPATIPDEHWDGVERIGEPTAASAASIVDQYNNLLQQVEDGELIRNVKLWVATEPQWTEIDQQFVTNLL